MALGRCCVRECHTGAVMQCAGCYVAHGYNVQATRAKVVVAGLGVSCGSTSLGFKQKCNRWGQYLVRVVAEVQISTVWYMVVQL